MTEQEIDETVAFQLGWKEGICSETEQVFHTSPSGEKFWAPQNYSASHDACRELFKFIDMLRPAGSVAMLGAMRGVIAPRMPKNKVGAPIISDWDLLMATPREICEAFLKSVEKLKK